MTAASINIFSYFGLSAIYAAIFKKLHAQVKEKDEFPHEAKHKQEMLDTERENDKQTHITGVGMSQYQYS